MVLRFHFQLILILALVFPLQAFAHTEQTAPPLVEITPQNAFLRVSVSGDLSDLLEATHPGTHDLDAAQSRTVMPDAKAFNYLLEGLDLEQGKILQGHAVKLVRFDDPTWPSGHGFIATLRYERPIDAQKQELRFSSRLFDYLESSRTQVTLREQSRSLPMGGEMAFQAKDTLPDSGQNLREWFGRGVSHATFGIEHLLFLLALLVCGTHFSLGFRLNALGLWVLSHGFSFGLAALGILSFSPQMVSVATALTLVVIGAIGYSIARGTMSSTWKHRGELSLLGLSAIAGLIHGLSFAPAERQLLPDVSLGFCLTAFFIGTALSGIGIFAVFALLFPRVKAYYDARESYGGMGWLSAARTASGAIGGVGVFFVLQRFLEASG